MGFFRICPREPKYNSYIFEDIDLKVIQTKGVEVNPDFDVQVTDLNKGYKHFKTYNGKGTSFKISVIIGKDEKLQGYKVTGTGSREIKEVINTVEVEIDGEMMTFNDEAVTGVEIFTTYDYYNAKLTTLLNWFMRMGIPFMVFSDIIGINTSVPYLITENKSRKQEYTDYSIWELTFTRWDEVNYSSFKKTNKGITKAINKMKAKKKAKAKAQAKAKTTAKNKLAKCKRKVLVYSKKQKTVDCVKTLQKVLNLDLKTKLKLDGWFGKETLKAVKKFQDKYKKKYGLKPNGKINKATFYVLIGKGKLLTKSKKTTNKKKTTPKKVKSITIKSDNKGIISGQLAPSDIVKKLQGNIG